MNKIKLDHNEIFEEFSTAQSYKNSIDLFNTVKRNENFYIGKQWEGVNAPNLPKPVLNILKRVVSYFISMIVSDDVSVDVQLYTGNADNETQQILSAVSKELEQVIEQNKMKTQNRQAIKNAAVDGDCCVYAWFDANVKTGNLTSGAIKAELLANTDVYFANPCIQDVQKQPFIIISYKKSAQSIKTAFDKKIALSTESVFGDCDEKVTVLRKLFKKNGTVWVCEVCSDGTITPPTNLGYTLYPLAWMSWEKVKNSYHGQSPMTPVIQNQIDINRLFAMCLKQVRDGAFPKVVYSKALLPDGWDNTVGAAIGVAGDVNQAVMRSTGVTEMSSQVLSIISMLINYTKETMGASDAALGNIDPRNTSAIIALQKSSAMPLELQRLDFYQFVEDYIRIFLDMMAVNYGPRNMPQKDENGKEIQQVINFKRLRDMQLRLRVNVGAGSYWSELSGIATLDNLFEKGIITDVETYIESLPSGVLPNKESILRKVREKANTLIQ